MYYNQLCADKAAMEVVTLNRRKQSQLLGVLFAEYEILTTEQASMIRDQMKRPQQVFKSTDSLWAFYNFVTNALQSSHPRTWMEDQRILHYFIGTICDFSAPVQPVSAPAAVASAPVVDPLYADPGQTNILDQIAEIENSEKVVQEEVISADDLHQSEENILDTNEAEENVLTEDELAHELYGVDNDIEVSIPGPCAAHDAETEREIQQENLEDIFPQAEITSLEPTPEEYELIEQEEILPWNDDEEPLSDALIEPAQVDNIEEAAVDPEEKTDYPITANLNVIESEDPDAFDLDFGDVSTDSNADFDF